jgi:transposase
MLLRAGRPFGAAAQQIAAIVRSSEVIASDETSARLKGKTHWQWTFGSTTAVYHVIAPPRGKCVPTDFLAGARPKVWLSDRLPAQCTRADAHQFCLAHLIRDAQYAINHGDTIFAPQFKASLKDACTVGRRRPVLADSTITTHRRRLDRE